MKLDNALNIKIDEQMFRELGKAANVLDCSQSEIVRRCIQLSLWSILRNPSLIQLLPNQTSQSINQG